MRTKLVQIIKTVGLIGFAFLFYYGTAYLLQPFVSGSVLLSLFTDLIMMLLLFSYHFFREKGKDEPPIVKSRRWFFACVVFLILLFFTCTFLGTFIYNVFPHESVVQYESSMEQAPFWLQCFLSFLIAPVTEEFLMRDFTYRLLSRISPVIVAASVSSVLFALAHGTTIHAVTGFLAGMFFAFVYEMFQSVWVPIAFHIAYNMMAVFTGHVLYPAFCFQPLFLGVVCFILFAGFLWLYHGILVIKENKERYHDYGYKCESAECKE